MVEIPDGRRRELEDYPNVVGTGIGTARVDGERTGEEALVVLVERKVPEGQLAPEDRLPASITVDGEPIRIDVFEVGHLRAESDVSLEPE